MSINTLSAPAFNTRASVAIADQAVAAIPSLDFWMDPAERAWEYGGGMHMQERKRGLILQAAGEVSQGTGINSTPSLSFGTNGRLVVKNYRLPEEFTIAALVQDRATVATLRTIFGRDGANGLGPSRMNFGLLQDSDTTKPILYSKLGGSASSVSSDEVMTGGDPHVVWVSVDAGGVVVFGIDTITPQASKTPTIAPSRLGVFGIGGIDGNSGTHFDEGGEIGPLMIFNKNLADESNAADLAEVVGYLATRGGVTLV